MITGKLKSDLDKLWLVFHSGGVTNPLTVIEQISFLMFARMLDLEDKRNERKAKVGGKAFQAIFPDYLSHLRWTHLVNVGSEELMRLLNGIPNQEEQRSNSRWMNLFQFYRNGLIGEQDDKTGEFSKIAEFFKDAQCMINKPSLAATAVSTINEFPILEGDTKGDLYEYLLSKLSSAGVAGQFRTPRHIIKTMVEIMAPEPTETICDPACGTAGFLTSSMEYLRKKYTTPGFEELEKDDSGKPLLDDHGKEVYHYPGDLLFPNQNHIDNDMFHGFDFDATMLRISAMNMRLHQVSSPSIEYKDTLSEQAGVTDQYANHFDVVLANPPFKGSIDGENVNKGLLSVAKTKKTELLFLVLIEKILKMGGRCAVIIPDGVLFGASKAHKAVREMLIENNQLEAVVSLPSGVFKPYAGVSTAILVFTKGGKTDNVLFYKVENDGYSLDDKRTPFKEDDLPDLLSKWKEWKDDNNLKNFEDKTQKAFYVPKADIVDNGYDLSINRYAEVVYEEIEYEHPAKILVKMQDMEKSIIADMKELEGMVK
jgi:type I restriction enzyme M protein